MKPIKWKFIANSYVARRNYSSMHDDVHQLNTLIMTYNIWIILYSRKEKEEEEEDKTQEKDREKGGLSGGEKGGKLKKAK